MATKRILASPKGGYVPIDPESLMLQELGHAIGLGGPVHKRYADLAFMDRLKDTMRFANAEEAVYDAIYMTGVTECASTSGIRSLRT